MSTDMNQVGVALFPSFCHSAFSWFNEQGLVSATVKARQHRREIRNLMKYISNYTVVLIMPYLYEDGVSEAWLQLSMLTGDMGYSVEDEEKFQLEPQLAVEVVNQAEHHSFETGEKRATPAWRLSSCRLTLERKGQCLCREIIQQSAI